MGSKHCNPELHNFRTVGFDDFQFDQWDSELMTRLEHPYTGRRHHPGTQRQGEAGSPLHSRAALSRLRVDAERFLLELPQKLSEKLRFYLSVFVRVCHGPQTDDGGIRPQEAHL